jgi:hypothetical protein
MPASVTRALSTLGCKPLVAEQDFAGTSTRTAPGLSRRALQLRAPAATALPGRFNTAMPL